ncbi:hypothetical protein OF83DRAFT_1028873, partial [Amylostereum chailletii]
MPVRWNTTHAEITRGIMLRPAANQWVEQLDRNLTGKKKTVATKKKKRWSLTVGDWDMLECLRDILEPFYHTTLDLSTRDEPTICKVLPLYKLLQSHLKEKIEEVTTTYGKDDEYHLADALRSGLERLEFYEKKALKSHYPLLGAILHPALRLSYFEDDSLWDPDLAPNARTILKYMCEEHASSKEPLAPSAPGATITPPSTPPSAAKSVQVPTTSLFAQAISRSNSSTTDAKPWLADIDAYFRGAYPCTSSDTALSWWKV